MRRLLLAFVLAALASVAPVASAAAPSATVVPGWPKALDAGTVLPGPQGGVVLVSPHYVHHYADGQSSYSVRAFRPDGRRLWAVSRPAGCAVGIVCFGGRPPVRQADGTYAPIGYAFGPLWAVNGAGSVVQPCLGVVLGDGSCVGWWPGPDTPRPAPPRAPAVSGRSAGATLPEWTVEVPGYIWVNPFSLAPATAVDGDGIVYVAFAGRHPIPTGTSGVQVRPGLLVAVDPVARRIVWTAVGPLDVLAGLGSGVLVRTDEGFAAYRGDGTVAWRQSLPPGEVVVGAAIHDPVRGRVYVGRSRESGDTRRGVTAFDAATGRQLWRTAPVLDATLMSVGRGGRVYLAIERPDKTSVRAVRGADGGAVWQRRTALPVWSVQELLNGTVAVSMVGPPGGRGRLTVLDPR